LPVILFSTHSKEGGYATFKHLQWVPSIFSQNQRRRGRPPRRHRRSADRKNKSRQRRRWPQTSPRRHRRNLRAEKRSSPRAAPRRIIAIGISTGGPNALQFVLSQIPADFLSTILIVQHMPEGFTEMFAKRLDECCALEIHEARSGDLLLAGRVLICREIAT